MVAISVVVFVYCALRAWGLSFTHDESGSYQIILGEIATSDLHPLNTLMMRTILALGGNSEFALRLPNVAALVIYLFSGIRLLREVRPFIALPAFAGYAMNPFVLEYFSLARGYGLGLAFMTASIACLKCARDRGSDLTEHNVAALYGCFGFALLSAVSNFCFVNYVVALGLATGTWLAPSILREDIPRRRLLFHSCVMALVSVAILGKIVAQLLLAKGRGELFTGGRAGFWLGTTMSLIDSSFYSMPYPIALHVTAIVMVALGLCLAVWALIRALEQRTATTTSLVSGILLLMVAAPLIQAKIFDLVYPTGRTAIYYIPLFALAVPLIADDALRDRAGALLWAAIPGNLLFFLLALHALASGNLRQTYTWPYDASTREAVEWIADYRSRHPEMEVVSIRNHWVFEPAINFYRSTRRYEWLTKATRAGYSVGGDFYYCFESDLALVPPDARRVASFEASRTVLLKSWRE